jgi:hypothetical protein
MNRLRVLIGCEESQEIAKAFRELGHEAYSNDLQDCSGGHPEWHIKGDVLEVIKINCWDLAIFHPDCTYLTCTANKWLKDQPERKSGVLVGEPRRIAQKEAIEFFMKLYNCDTTHIAIENPIGVMSSAFRKPNQILQPWQFGHGEVKATCLWTRNLPILSPTDVVSGRVARSHNVPPSPERSKIRSRTYPGIAKAIAKQYSDYVIKYKRCF